MSEVIKYYRYLQFYADKQNCYSNKFFSFQIADINEILSILAHFRLNGNSFRAIFYNTSMSYMGVFSKDSHELIDYYNFFKLHESVKFKSKSEIYDRYKFFKAGF